MRAFLGIIIASLAASALGACPDQCSGHGYCNDVDRCVCYKRQGTKSGEREMWTGPACSLQVCPYGRAHSALSTTLQTDGSSGAPALPMGFIGAASTSKLRLGSYIAGGFKLQRDADLDISVVAVTTNGGCGGSSCVTDVVFKFKWDHRRTWDPPITATDDATPANDKFMSLATAHEVTVGAEGTGLFLYWDLPATSAVTDIAVGDRYFLNVTWTEGLQYSSADPNSAHQHVECSGRGSCDRGTGQCLCDKVFTGDGCQRRKCMAGCSQHGTCVSLSALASDNGLTYSGFDATAQYSCLCDEGYRGADCSQQECPSSADPNKGHGGNGLDFDGASGSAYDCSGRGLCDFETGQCECHEGFHGTACELKQHIF